MSVYSVIKLMELKYVVLVLKNDCAYRPDTAAVSFVCLWYRRL